MNVGGVCCAFAHIHLLFYVLFISCDDAIRLYLARINEVEDYLTTSFCVVPSLYFTMLMPLTGAEINSPLAV